MIKAQDEELKNLIAPSKTAAKIKRMMLIHKHMVAMEKMRSVLYYSSGLENLLVHSSLGVPHAAG